MLQAVAWESGLPSNGTRPDNAGRDAEGNKPLCVAVQGGILTPTDPCFSLRPSGPLAMDEPTWRWSVKFGEEIAGEESQSTVPKAIHRLWRPLGSSTIRIPRAPTLRIPLVGMVK